MLRALVPGIDGIAEGTTAETVEKYRNTPAQCSIITIMPRTPNTVKVTPELSGKPVETPGDGVPEGGDRLPEKEDFSKEDFSQEEDGAEGAEDESSAGDASSKQDAPEEDEVEKALLEAISQSSKGSYVSRAEKSADYPALISSSERVRKTPRSVHPLLVVP